MIKRIGSTRRTRSPSRSSTTRLPPLLRPALAPAISNVYMRQPRSSARPPIISPSVFTASLSESAIEIPRSVKARVRDDELLQIRAFHESVTLPAEISRMSDVDERARGNYQVRPPCFRLLSARRSAVAQAPERAHKLVIPITRRFALLVQAHAELGHKGIFTVRARLLERFWWPSLDRGRQMVHPYVSRMSAAPHTARHHSPNCPAAYAIVPQMVH